jgi:hypothetical protein
MKAQSTFHPKVNEDGACISKGNKARACKTSRMKAFTHENCKHRSWNNHSAGKEMTAKAYDTEEVKPELATKRMKAKQSTQQ